MPKTQTTKRKSTKTKKQEALRAQKLFKKLKPNSSPDRIQPGHMYLFNYKAKCSEDDLPCAYDKSPCCIVLGVSSTHVLGINLHWAPLGLREKIVDSIFKIAKFDVKKGKPLNLNYQQLKPLIDNLTLPIIRQYIKKRIRKKVILVPDSLMMTASKYSNENFSMPSPEVLYKVAFDNHNKTPKTKRKKRKK